MRLRATSTEASNGASASAERVVQVVLLAGSAVDTPAGVNPYVTLGTETAPSYAGTTSAVASGGAPLQAVPVGNSASTALTLDRGQALVAGPRTPEEEAAAEEARLRRLSEAWIASLEKSARAQWNALMGVSNDEPAI